MLSGFGISSCGVGVCAFTMLVGIGGACIMLIRLSRLASVGLMVRAPRPDALPDAIDCLLLPDEEGVCALFWPDFDAFTLFGVFGFSEESRGAGCRLLTLFCLDCVVGVKVVTRGSSAPADA